MDAPQCEMAHRSWLQHHRLQQSHCRRPPAPAFIIIIIIMHAESQEDDALVLSERPGMPKFPDIDDTRLCLRKKFAKAIRLVNTML